ncbi:MAG TPA: GNAT family N-acetyltransferase [Flavisolibacter sp.]|nr:GNAT family N-acetyltransferase [Flavisolibacter sp.]
MKIRPASLADVPALNLLVNGAYRGDSSRKGWTTEADLLDGIRTSEPALQKMIEKPGALILVLEENDQINACVYLEKKEHRLYLGMLTVDPALQGKGLGAHLMKAAEEKAAELNCDIIQMSVITERESLIHYYQRKGFHDTGERLPFPDDPAFGIPKQPLQFMIMEKELHK